MLNTIEEIDAWIASYDDWRGMPFRAAATRILRHIAPEMSGYAFLKINAVVRDEED